MTWKVPVLLAVLGVVAFIFFGLMGPNQTARFGISSSGDFFQLPAIQVPAFLGGIVLSVLMLGLAAYAVYLKTRNQASPGWLPIVFIVLFVAAFLIWVVGGAAHPQHLAGGPHCRFGDAGRSARVRLPLRCAVRTRRRGEHCH